MSDTATSRMSSEAINMGSGEVGCYLIHGFTGSPFELQGLADHLANLGYRVHAPLLPGHGTTVEECNMVRAADWIEAVEFQFTELLLECDKAFVIGLSMGASLALHLASLLPVSGVVAMSSIIGRMPVRKAWLLPWMSPFISAIPKTRVYKGINPDGHAYYGYDSYPVKGTRQMLALNQRVQGELSEVVDPVLVIHSKADITAHIDNAQFLMEAVGSEDKELLILEEASHILPVSSEKETVLAAISDFIARLLSKTDDHAIPVHESR